MRNIRNAFRLIFLGAVMVGIVVIVVLLKVPAHSPNESTPLAQIPSETNVVPLQDNSSEPLILSDSFSSAMALISSERMFTTLEDLTTIQSHSGWRGSATINEKDTLVAIGHRCDQLVCKGKIGPGSALVSTHLRQCRPAII